MAMTMSEGAAIHPAATASCYRRFATTPDDQCIDYYVALAIPCLNKTDALTAVARTRRLPAASMSW